jgi:DNA-binding CsgD family transcriptional regulator
MTCPGPEDFTENTSFHSDGYAGVTLSSRHAAHFAPTEVDVGEAPATQSSDEERWTQMITIRGHKIASWPPSLAKSDLPYALFDDENKPEAPDQMASKLLCPEWRGPAMVIDCTTLRVDFANQNCLALLSKNFGLRLQNGQLIFTQCHERKTFHTQIQAARATGRPSSAKTFRNVENGAWVLSVVRFLGTDEAAAVMRTTNSKDEILDPAVIEFTECGYAPDHECFRAVSEALKLSPSESRDLIAIATGYTADEIAVNRGVAISTIRQRIKSLLAKAECSRQQELTCLVRSLCPTEHDKLDNWPELHFGFAASYTRAHAIAAE